MLLEQDGGDVTPVYDRGKPINGMILLEDSEAVTHVEIKVRLPSYFLSEARLLSLCVQVEGKLETLSSEAGGHSVSLLNNRYVIWPKRGSHSAQSCSPTSLPFAIVLPSTFKDAGSEYSLPPSYEPISSDFHDGFFVKTSYSLRVTATRSVGLKFASVSRSTE